MARSEVTSLVQSGREISSEEIELVREVIDMCSGLSRDELARTICEHLNWVTVSKSHKVHACQQLLDKLEEQGIIRLPPKRVWTCRQPLQRPRWTAQTNPRPELRGSLADVRPVHLEAVDGDVTATKQWKEYVDRYHMLGYKRPFGFRQRYFVVSRQGVLGCLLVAGAAKAIGVRDRWIGWTARQRQQNIGRVVNNSRFLLFPWVQIQHLASHVLGQLARQVGPDYEARFGYRPLLLETFVDPAHFSGTSYQAAGWQLLGQTKGKGLCRPGRQYKTTPKLIFVRPLTRDFRQQLCSDERVPGGMDESLQANSNVEAK